MRCEQEEKGCVGDCSFCKEKEAEIFEVLFDKQINFQKRLTKNAHIPIDNCDEFRNQICLMTEELGELAKTDKRWRQKQDKQTVESGNKLEELADVFIVAMNLVMFSGFNYDDILSAINTKLSKNEKKKLQ